MKRLKNTFENFLINFHGVQWSSHAYTHAFSRKMNQKEDEHCFFFFIKRNCPPLKSISDRHSNLFEMSKQKNALKCSTIWFVGCITSEENKTRWMSALMTIRRQILLKTTPSPKPKNIVTPKKCVRRVSFFTQCNAYTHENMIGIFEANERMRAMGWNIYFSIHRNIAYYLVYNSSTMCIASWNCSVIFMCYMALYHLSNILLLWLLVCLHDLNSSPTIFGHGWMILDFFSWETLISQLKRRKIGN